MSQIFISAKSDAELDELKGLLLKNNFKVEFAKGEWRFTPILVDFKSRLVRNITSATMCHCMFNLAKNPLISFCNFKNILNLTKE